MQVVTLDKIRILSRLRSRHARATRKTVGKPALLGLLSRAINDPSLKPSGKSAKAKVAKARSQTRDIVEAFNGFEAAYDVGDPSLSQERLVDVLTQAYEFDVDNLQVALRNPSLISSSTVTFLPQAIRKLGRYYCVACDLTDAARSSQYAIFGRITIKVLEEPVLDAHSIADDLLSFDATFERITSMSHQGQIHHYDSKSLSLARAKYNARISSSLTPWKIHAEIQLLFFYELNSDIPSPRWICSSKSACYLCDLFIKLNGKFRLPRTHGRLYDKWILPEWSIDQCPSRQSLQSAIDRFNSTLEKKILQVLNTRMPPFQHPNESVLHVRQPWSSNSTLPALESRRSIAEASDDGGVKISIELEEFPPTDPAGDGFSSRTAFGERDIETGKASTRRVPPNISQTAEGQQEIVSPSDSVVVFLSRGDALCHRLTRPCDTLVVRTGAITLHASWDWSSTDFTKSASDAPLTQDSCWVRVNWLPRGGPIADGDQDVDSVDLENLSNTTDSFQETVLKGGSALSHKVLSIQKGGHVLVIRYYWEDPHCE